MSKNIFYRPQQSCGQGYVFTRVCDSVHSGGGVLPQCMLECHSPGSRPPEQTPPPEADTPWEQTPPRSRHPPEQTPRSRHLPPRADTPPGSRHPSPPSPGADNPPSESRLQHTVNEWPARILLECILVKLSFNRKNLTEILHFEKKKIPQTTRNHNSKTNQNYVNLRRSV